MNRDVVSRAALLLPICCAVTFSCGLVTSDPELEPEFEIEGPLHIERASIALGGGESNGDSRNPSLSEDGSWVTFESLATDLVSDDTNGVSDVFVRDLASGVTTRVSIASDGTEGNGDSRSPSISGDGRFVAFESKANNLVADDENDALDVFVRDLASGVTTRVSIASDGTEGNGDSRSPSISGDGRFVTFHSRASNFVPNNTKRDDHVFVHDRELGTTTRVSVATNGTVGNASSTYAQISTGGNAVVFQSFASNFVDDLSQETHVFVHDRDSNQTSLASIAPDTLDLEQCHSPSLSADARIVAFACLVRLEPTQGKWHVLVRDRGQGVTSLVSAPSSEDLSLGGGDAPRVSANGRFVSFWSNANDLVAGDTNDAPDVFVHDRETSETTRISVSVDGVQAEFNRAHISASPLSAQGHIVAFTSAGRELVPDKESWHEEIFVCRWR